MKILFKYDWVCYLFLALFCFLYLTSLGGLNYCDTDSYTCYLASPLLSILLYCLCICKDKKITLWRAMVGILLLGMFIINVHQRIVFIKEY